MPDPADTKPCPFCGTYDPSIDEVQPGVWALACNECGAIGPHYDTGTAPERAIAAWNMRP